MLEQLTDDFVEIMTAVFGSGEEKVNDLGNYKDANGITHIYVMDQDTEFELIDGNWTEKAVF